MRMEQLRAVLWLRWRLTRNQWRRAGAINAFISLMALWVGFGTALAGILTGMLVGALAMTDATPVAVQVAWDVVALAFLFFSWVGVMSELQKSETIDIGRLLHLPVALRDVFRLNYALSNFKMSVIIWLPAMLGLATGLVWGRGLWFIAMIPLVLLFHYMATAWLCLLRGWLVMLLVKTRHSKMAVVGAVLIFVVIIETPVMVVLYVGHRSKSVPGGEKEAKEQLIRWIEWGHRVVPILWLPQAGRALAENRPLTAAGCGAGMFLVGLLAMRMAYRNTLRFHQGDYQHAPVAEDRRHEVSDRGRSRRPLFVGRRIPWVPDPVAALALANLRAMSRATEVRMNVGVIVILMAGGSLLLWGQGPSMGGARLFAASGAVMATFFGLGQFMFNQFGFDRDGFRSLVLAPADRAHVLAGKNLSVLPVALVLFVLFHGLMAMGLKLSLTLIVAVCFQFGMAFLMLSVAGNLASVLVPYYIASGTLRGTKTSWLTSVIMWLTQIPFALVMLLTLLPAGIGAVCHHQQWLPAELVVVTMSALLLIVAGMIYWWTLKPMGRLLERREQKILQVVTREIE